MEHVLGKPKYKENDKVQFMLRKFTGEEITCCGTIYIVDAYGTFEQNEEPSYDILVDDWDNTNAPCLVKHVRESNLVKQE